MLTMTDDTKLTNSSIPRYGTPTSKEDTLLTDFTQVARSIFKGGGENRQSRKIRADLVRNYIAKPESETNSVFRKFISFLKG
jgi:hypothetical protein